MALPGDVLRYLIEKGAGESLTIMIGQLDILFGVPVTDIQDKRDKLEKMHRGRDETSRSFCTRLIMASSGALWPGETVEEVVKRRFIACIDCNTVGPVLKDMQRQNRFSLQDLIMKASLLELDHRLARYDRQHDTVIAPPIVVNQVEDDPIQAGDKAPVATFRGRGGRGRYNGKRGTGIRRPFTAENRTDREDLYISTATCNRCGGKGHFARECPTKDRDRLPLLESTVASTPPTTSAADTKPPTSDTACNSICTTDGQPATKQDEGQPTQPQRCRPQAEGWIADVLIDGRMAFLAVDSGSTTTILATTAFRKLFPNRQLIVSNETMRAQMEPP
jgi:hypothetical protein